MITKALTPKLLDKMHAYWRAANYLAVGQIYLYDNPLLKRPLTLAHDDGRGRQALHRGHRYLAMGQQRPGRCAGRGIDKNGEDLPEIRNWKWAQP